MHTLFCFIFFLFASVSAILSTPIAKQGVLDLRDWDFQKKGNIQIYGEWEFYWKELLPPDFKNSNYPKEWIEVPSLWNDRLIRNEKLTGSGYATLRLKVLLPPNQKVFGFRIGDMYSSYKLYVDGYLVAQNGEVGTSKETTLAQWLPHTKIFYKEKEETEILLQIANFHHRKGGTWSDLQIGEPDKIIELRLKAIIFDLFLLGSLLIMALYHVGLYLLRKKERSTIFFALFCFAAIARILVTGERYLVHAFPELPFEFQLKLEYMSFFVSIPLFVFFLFHALPGYVSKNVLKFSIFVMSLLTLLVLFTDGTIYSHTAIPAQIIVFILLIHIIYKLFQAIQHKSKGGIAALIGIFFLVSTFIVDILYNNELISFGNIAPVGVFLFIFSQSFLLSQNFSQAFQRIEILSDDIQETNKVYSYFVPKEFLQLLNINNIKDIKLGDLAERKMTILFSDIRNFTKISETMTPMENFEFINSYLKIVAPYIVKNRGFIDKYIGDGIMAIFPESPFDALDSAIEMFQALELINEERSKRGKEIIAIGIGIHTGEAIIGTVGALERMEGTVISDVVNLASRLESLTKELGAKILISKDVFDSLPDQDTYHHRYLGQIEIKGKSKKVKIWEVFVGNDPFTEFKKKHKKDWERAVHLFESGDLENAKVLFQNMGQLDFSDKSLEYYLKRV
jgi:adenylate cyclase